VTKIARKTDHLHGLIPAVEGRENLRSAILATIIDKYELVCIAEAAQDINELLVQRLNVLFLIIDRDSNGELMLIRLSSVHIQASETDVLSVKFSDLSRLDYRNIRR
jgi:hypothetical protein